LWLAGISLIPNVARKHVVDRNFLAHDLIATQRRLLALSLWLILGAPPLNIFNLAPRVHTEFSRWRSIEWHRRRKPDRVKTKRRRVAAFLAIICTGRNGDDTAAQIEFAE